jgi:hypothetical protein
MNGSFYVTGPDGNQYGPADEATLGQWAREGRIVPQTVLVDAGTQQSVYAGHVPSLAALFGLAQQPAVPAFTGATPYGGAMHSVGYSSGYNPGAGTHSLTVFSPGTLLLLHFVTCGLYTLYVHFGLMHDRLPPRRSDDPSAGKAIGFMFVPFFNLYWIFFVNLRLIDRINEQRQAAGLPPNAPRGLALTTCIMMVIPYVNILALLIMVPIYAAVLQSNVNELVRATRRSRA